MKKPVDFTYIRYANCWEDADLLLGNTRPLAGEHILSIASAGDNSLAFLAFAPAQVLAFDINPAQLCLVELKQMAIKHLGYQEALSFLGFKESAGRAKTFQHLSNYLSEGSLKYFARHLISIDRGIIHQGKFENYFRLFRTYVMPLIHSKKKINSLFFPRSEQEQHIFYEQQWNTWRWRLLFRLFFSRFILGRFGRDPRFFDEVKKSVSESIFDRAETQLKSMQVAENFYLDYQLRGNFEVALPFYMRPENFEKIKSNIDNLQLFKGALTEIPLVGKFDVLNLSNIFEYMNETVFKTQADFISGICNSNVRIAYWNLLVKRQLNSIHSRYQSLPVRGKDLCFFYESFNLNNFK